MTTDINLNINDKKFKNQTVTLGKKGVTDVRINLSGEYSDAKTTASGSDIIVTVYGTNNKVLGKVTIKNGAKEGYCDNPEYSAAISYSGSPYDDLFTKVYDLGDWNSTKNQTIKGTALNEVFYSGYADDKMYSGGGADEFIIYQGDAKGKTGDIIYGSDGNDTLILEAYSGHEYGEDELTLYKEGDNLRIYSQGYALDKSMNPIEGGVEDNIIIDKYFANSHDDRIQIDGIDLDEYTQDDDIYVIGDKKKANTLNGSEYDDYIEGGDKNDKITTGGNNYLRDYIDGGKGNDTITVNGLGTKRIYVEKGEGNDVIDIGLNQMEGYEDAPAVFDTYNTDAGKWDLTVNANIGYDESAEITYTKRGADLIISVSREDDKATESVTVKNYYSLVEVVENIEDGAKKVKGDSINYELLHNGKNIEEAIDNTQYLNIAGVKVTELIGMIEKEMPAEAKIIADGVLKKIKLPSSIANANVFVGSMHNDSIVGSNNKDVMLSTGGKYNYFETGKKGQTAILSLGDSMDMYNVQSFNAGTVIYDSNDNYWMAMNGVNTNDIHMVSSDLIGSLSKSKASSSIQAQYFTDSKGISNIKGINIESVINKVVDAESSFNSKKAKDEYISKDQAKAINSVIDTATNIIDKFRGVAIVSQKDNEYITTAPKGTEAKMVVSMYKPIFINTDGASLEMISAESQETSSYLTSESMMAYSENIERKFGFGMEGVMGVISNPSEMTFEVGYIEERKSYDEIDDAFIKKYYKFVKATKDTEAHYVLSKTAINEIKDGFFEIFQNSLIGTNGDNSFSVSHSDSGAAIAAGFGNDTITFNGDLSSKYTYNKTDAYNLENYPDYNIRTSLDEGEHDTLVFKNHTLGKDLSGMSLIKSVANPDTYIRLNLDEDEGVIRVEGAKFSVYKEDKNSDSYAEINYGIGEDTAKPSGYSIMNREFALTVKDKSSTYEVTAEYNSGSIVKDWSGSKNNHQALMFADHKTVTSGKGNDIITSNTTDIDVKAVKSLDYTYGGGSDIVISNGTSYDDYYVNMTDKTDLFIIDQGEKDYDYLNLDNKKANNLRLFFNVDKYGNLLDDTTVTIVSGKLSKSSFEISDYYGNQDVDGVKKGITFNYNYSGYDDGIEYVTYNEGKTIVTIDSMIDNIRSQVVGFLNENQFGDVEQAILEGNKNQVNKLFNIYNSYNLGMEAYNTPNELV